MEREKEMGAGASESKSGMPEDDDSNDDDGEGGEVEGEAEASGGGPEGSATSKETGKGAASIATEAENVPMPGDVAALSRALAVGKARGGRALSREEREATRLMQLEQYGTGASHGGAGAGAGCRVRVMLPGGVALRGYMSPYENVGSLREMVMGALDEDVGVELESLRGRAGDTLDPENDEVLLAEAALVPRASIEATVRRARGRGDPGGMDGLGWYLHPKLREELATKC